MQFLSDFLNHLRDVQGLVQWAGALGVVAIIFAETGLLLGFFFPGDSLLVSSGLLAATMGLFNIYGLGVALSVAAVAGNTLGYFIGRATGPRLFARENSLLFRREHLHRAHAFYERHGGKTVVLARFMPIVRTFVPVVAGAAYMDLGPYTLYNIVGGVAWIWSMLFIGYFLGRYIPGIDRHIDLVIAVVIVISMLPGIVGWLRARARSRGDHPARAPADRNTVSDI